MTDEIINAIFPETTEYSETRRKMLTNKDLEECYKYRIMLKPDLYKEAHSWCMTNFPKDTEAHWSDRRWFTGGAWDGFKYYYHFNFKTSEDAVMFALRWK